MHTQDISEVETLRIGQRHPLINHNFALLWSGQTVSLLGTYVFDTMLIVWVGVVLARGQSWTPLAVSGIALASSLPSLLLTPMAGVFVDRWNKRQALLWSTLLPILGLVPLLVAVEAGKQIGLAWQLGMLYLTVFLINSCSIVARRILLPVPFVFIALGPVLVGITSGLAAQARKSLIQHIGTDNKDMLTIQSKTRKLDAGAFLTLSFLVWYLPVIRGTAPLPLLLLIGGVSLLLLALALLFLWLDQRQTALYLEKLSPQERLEEGKQRRMRLLTRLGILLLLVLLELFTGPFVLTFPPHTLEQWSYDASLPLLLCWLAWEVTNGIRNRLWRRNPFANEKERTL